LFGNIDPNVGRSTVRNPGSVGATAGGAQQTGRLGQAQSFQGNLEADAQRRQFAQDQARQTAIDQQNAIQAELQAAEQRDAQARQEALANQQFELQKLNFENQQKLQAQQQAEEIRNRNAQTVYQLQQQGGINPPSHNGVPNYTGDFSAFNTSFARGLSGPHQNYSKQFMDGLYNNMLAQKQRQLDKWKQYDAAMQAAGMRRKYYADGRIGYVGEL